MASLSAEVCVGRTAELTLLDGVLGQAASGRSGSLLLVGEAGVGKTHLLNHMVERSDGFRVLRVAGAESETPVVFSGLQRLLSPLTGRLDSLPLPQHRALATALGLSDAPAQRLHLGLAVLSTLTQESADHPLLVVVDDAHLVDPATLGVLGFVARRLEADAVAIILSSRSGEVPKELADLRQVELGGLSPEAVGELLGSLQVSSYDPLTLRLDRLVEATGGNPLALVELATSADDSLLRAALRIPGGLSVGELLTDHFEHQVSGLPEGCRRLLLLAAANGLSDADVMWVAAAALGLSPEDADPAIEAGIWSYETRPSFRHPLIRSAVYASAAPSARRQVHLALADATDAEADRERSVWHRACATVLYDDEVAALLEECAGRVSDKGGHAIQAMYLTRSAELTTAPARRIQRQMSAGQAFLRAGDLPGAQRMLDASWDAGDPRQRVDHTRLQAVADLAGGEASSIASLLLSVLEQARALGPASARSVILDAVGAAFMSGRHMTGVGAAELYAAAVSQPVDPALTDHERTRGRLAEAGAARMHLGYRDAAPLMQAAVAEVVRDEVDMDGAIGLTTLAVLMPAELWDLASLRVIGERYRERDLAQGSLGSLRSSQGAVARVHLMEGDFALAQVLMSEMRGLVAMLSPEPSRVDTPYEAELLVWTGEEERARSIIHGLIHHWGAQIGHGVLEDWGRVNLAVLENSLGNYEEAYAAAVATVDHDQMPWASQALPEVIEAAVRSRREDEAAVRLQQLRDRVACSGTAWSRGLLARSEAICATGPVAEDHFRRAIALLATSGVRTEHARSVLLYGEWLRREGRKADAQVQLGAALELFDAMGARLFSRRAEAELRATGVRVHRDAGTTRELTPQEQQVAVLGARGLTNREIATRLFIGESTVEFHMTKVLRKLDIRSRRRLREILVDSSPASAH